MSAIDPEPAPGDASPRSTSSAFRATLEGAWRFALLSVVAFSVWAFAGRWFYRGLGEGALFAAVAVVFLVLAGPLLAPLLPQRHGSRRIATLYRVFVPAFVVYAIVWSASWFLLRYGAGEWLGGVLGSIAFVAVIALSLDGRDALRDPRRLAIATVVFFVAHSIGYFAGGALAYSLFRAARDGAGIAGLSPAATGGMGALAWGLVYGLGFGAGIGYTFFACRRTAER